MPPIDMNPPKTCVECQTHFPHGIPKGAAGAAWVPLRIGWCCSDCTRAYNAKIEGMAQQFAAAHRESRKWLDTAQHTEYERCLWCDVLRRATSIVVCAPERPTR